jgi:alpha-tubulin suppressor-like RCC1 family protein
MPQFSPRRNLLAVAILFSACTGEAPLDPEPLDEPLASITAGGHTTCALTVSGRAFCWGRGTDGQLGNGGATSTSTPVPVAGDLRFTALTAGYYHTCGLAEGGRPYCWGAQQERYGQLGNGGTGGSARPVAVSGPAAFTQLSAGQVHTCGLAPDGVAYCWGDNTFGQLGDGSTRGRTTPGPVSGGERFAWIGAGALHTCGVTRDGRVLCWGDNFFGSVTGDPNAHTPDTCGAGGDPRCTLFPHPVQAGVPFTNVDGGDALTCGGTAGGAWWCWGGSAQSAKPPAQIEPGPGMGQVVAGSSHTCAQSEAGQVRCQGGNNLGQLGAGIVSEFSGTPVSVQSEHAFRSLAAGMFHTCAVTRDGVAYCWGGNRDGQLGNGSPHTCWGSYPCSTAPQPVRRQ